MNLVHNGFMRTFSTRLSLALVMIVVAVGIGVFVSSQAGMRSYYEEFNQKLNSSIAMYITGEYQLIQQENDTINQEVLTSLAQTAMVINPGVEVYVLDTAGNIIGHNFPVQSILHNTIPLQPLLTFIAGSAQYPFRSIDPRHSQLEKVFSASEIRNDGVLQGYLYVILGGEVYDNIEDGLNNSTSRTMVFISILVIVLAALITGIILFRVLVRRLSHLSQRMQSFTDTELNLFGLETNINDDAAPKDEIDLLTSTFEGLTAKVTEQFTLLHEADNIKRELISNVSHDLRTPLANIQGYLETLLIKNSTLSEPDRLKYLQTAMKSSRRLGLLISDLFELSKLESNQAQVNIEAFSLAELIYDTVQEFQLELDTKKIILEICDSQNNTQVYADIGLIQRVFENLIRNAIAYTPEHGKVVLRIEPLLKNSNRDLKVSISDTGRGIKEEDLPHIFDRFYSNSDRSRQDVTSTGLGLAIVKRILELHDTKISVDSRPDQGACFEFSLSTQAA